MNLYNKNFDDLKKKVNLRDKLSANNGQYFAAKQLLKLHQDAFQRENPIIVELGVDIGTSTKTFLNAIANKPKAYLISVDIDDCSSAASSSKWTFIHSDSTNIEFITREAPIIEKRGIDLLYIDSSHSAKHVKKSLNFFIHFLIRILQFFLMIVNFFLT